MGLDADFRGLWCHSHPVLFGSEKKTQVWSVPNYLEHCPKDKTTKLLLSLCPWCNSCPESWGWVSTSLAVINLANGAISIERAFVCEPVHGQFL